MRLNKTQEQYFRLKRRMNTAERLWKYKAIIIKTQNTTDNINNTKNQQHNDCN